MVNLKPVGALARVQVVFIEVDGVFTDGKTWQDRDGRWRRTFSVRDTMGVRALRKAGLKVCVLTPALSTEITAHFEKVGVDIFKDHCLDLSAAHQHILRAYGLTHEHAVFMSETSAGQVELRTKDGSLYLAARSGGDGAVLEISNLILQTIASLPAGQQIASHSAEATDSRLQVGEL